jgi:hypothetical protein
MSELAALERLEIALTYSKEEAASLGDDLLVYVISMGILQIRKKKAGLGKAVDAKPTGLRLVAA